MNGPEEKAALRRRMRRQLDATGVQDRRAASEAVCALLLGRLEELNVRTLLAFHPAKREIGILPLLETWLAGGHRLLLPRVGDGGWLLEYHRVGELAAEVLPGFKGIMEPDPELCPLEEAASADAVLVPGVAFDVEGRRLGQGGGHYDRLLAGLPSRVRRIGAGFDFQILEEALPAEAHDEPVDEIATPSRLHVVRPAKKEPLPPAGGSGSETAS